MEARVPYTRVKTTLGSNLPSPWVLKKSLKYWSREKVVRDKVVQNSILNRMVFVYFSLRAIF